MIRAHRRVHAAAGEQHAVDRSQGGDHHQHRHDPPSPIAQRTRQQIGGNRLRPARPVEAQPPQKGGIDEQINQRDGRGAEDQGAGDGARTAAHVRGDKGRIVPTAVSEEAPPPAHWPATVVPVAAGASTAARGCGQPNPATRMPPSPITLATVSAFCVPLPNSDAEDIEQRQHHHRAGGPQPAPLFGTLHKGAA